MLLLLSIGDVFAGSQNDARPQAHVPISPHPAKSGQIKDYTQADEPASEELPHAQPYSSPSGILPPGIPMDLSHPLNNDTLHWPEAEGFTYIKLVDEERSFSYDGSKYHVKQDSFRMSTHAGTHIDAPSHFSRKGWNVNDIPLWRLVDVPLVVVDLRDLPDIKFRGLEGRNETVTNYIEKKHLPSDIAPGSVVVVYTGISELYDLNPDRYFTTSKDRDRRKLNLPGFSMEAANYLVEREVFGVGIDTLSVDSSNTLSLEVRDPLAHHIFSTNNIYMLENLSSKLKILAEIQKTDPSAKFTITTLPLAIEGASGSPVRVIAKLASPGVETNSGSSMSDKLASLLPMTLTPLVSMLLALRAAL